MLYVKKYCNVKTRLQVAAIYGVGFDSCWSGRLWTPKKNGLPQPLALPFFCILQFKYLLANNNQHYICIIMPNLWQNWPSIFNTLTSKRYEKKSARSQWPALFYLCFICWSWWERRTSSPNTHMDIVRPNTSFFCIMCKGHELNQQ